MSRILVTGHNGYIGTVMTPVLQLLMEHFPTQAGRDWFTADTFEALMRIRGLEARAPEGKAEGFYARKLIL